MYETKHGLKGCKKKKPTKSGAVTCITHGSSVPVMTFQELPNTRTHFGPGPDGRRRINKLLPHRLFVCLFVFPHSSPSLSAPSLCAGPVSQQQLCEWIWLRRTLQSRFELSQHHAPLQQKPVRSPLRPFPLPRCGVCFLSAASCIKMMPGEILFTPSLFFFPLPSTPPLPIVSPFTPERM